MPRQEALPPTLSPRLIAREAAAAYVCVSPNFFDRLVNQKIMPQPRVLGDNRQAWDVRELDASVDALPRGGETLTQIDDGWTE